MAQSHVNGIYGVLGFKTFMCIFCIYTFSFRVCLSCNDRQLTKKSKGKMTIKNNGMEAGAVETPAINNSAALYSYAPNLYINNSQDDELKRLKENQLIKDFANVKPDLYKLVASTNPTLKLFFDVARRIMEAEV